MDLQEDQELLYIARSSLQKGLPGDWKICKPAESESQTKFFYNTVTKELQSMSPCVAIDRKEYLKEKESRLKLQQEMEELAEAARKEEARIAQEKQEEADRLEKARVEQAKIEAERAAEL
jgi:hypothetical protein